MEKKKMPANVRTYILLAVLFLILCLPADIRVKAGTDGKAKAKEIFDGIVSYNIAGPETSDIQEFIDKDLIGKVGGTAEWYVLGLSQYGNYDFTKYRTALEDYLSSREVKGASAKLKFALLLAYVDADDSFWENVLYDDSIGSQGIMSYVFGLHIINNGYKGNISGSDIFDTLKALRHEDGGWSVTGNFGDVDVTAMVLQALAPGYLNNNLYELSEGQKEDLKDLVQGGVDFLSARQQEDGDFASFGVRNAESTAQVITALSALGIDCAQDERFIKNGNSPIDGLLMFRLKDGSFSHKAEDVSSPSATVQTFYSMVAYLRMCEGQTPLYVRDKNEKKLAEILNDSETEPSTVDTSEKDVTTVTESTASQTETNANPTESATSPNGDKSGYKPFAMLIITGVCLVVCFVLLLLKKHWKNFLFVGIVGIVGILIVIFTDFSSPENYYGTQTEKNNAVGTVTMSIRCDILEGKEINEHIPKDYCILADTQFNLEDGETAYDILLEAAKQFGISVEHEGSSDIIYISGINYLYENDYGDLSGWVYKVNGTLPSIGCGGYKLSPGDVIEWCYTLDLGNDAVME
ncbi:MAG: DUF4430 domain-containing protein [Lachnospiraceae bacterium]|nr:DUF4430 domain-containing protein [Lachnospiraceae bacterium]